MEKKVNIFERLLYLTLIAGVCFFTGVFYTYYKIDQRLWNEDIVKARDIETRYMNYPTKRNYKQDDLNRIITYTDPLDDAMFNKIKAHAIKLLKEWHL